MGNFPPETIDRGGLIEIPLCVEKVRNVRIDLNEYGDGVALARPSSRKAMSHVDGTKVSLRLVCGDLATTTSNWE